MIRLTRVQSGELYVTSFWKALSVANLLLALIALFYAYAANHPNPYGPEYYEREQMKLELRTVVQELETIRKTQADACK